MDAIYNKIGIGYNQTRNPDPYLTEQLFLYLQPKPNGSYLDIGCGTGNYTTALANKGFSFVGIDPSHKMLEEAKKKNSDIEWHLGSAENIDFSGNSFDGAIACLTIHHWVNLKKGFKEIKRVLKPDGNFIIFTSTPQQMKSYWLNHYFPEMMKRSIAQMPTLNYTETALNTAGFQIIKTVPYTIHKELEDHFLYCGKQRPEVYLDPSIRHGISSFSALAYQAEVKKGLEKLRKDIENGVINRVIKSYDSSLGDYLYIVAK